MIAPFLSEVDTVEFQPSEPVRFGLGGVDGRRAFGATYRRVRGRNNPPEKENTFQVILIDRGNGDFDIEFNYDSITWDKGLSDSACVGYSSPDRAFTLPGCNIAGTYLDGRPQALNRQRLNSSVNGRLVFQIRAGTALPLNLTRLSPDSATAGSPDLVLHAEGSGFQQGASIRFENSVLPTTFLSTNLVRATVPASLLAQPRTVPVRIDNPGGAFSNSLPFVISQGLRIDTLSPNFDFARTPDSTVTITGTGFAQGAVAQWNGTPLVTTFVSSTQLRATIPASFKAVGASVTANINVQNPNDAVSNALPFTVLVGLRITELRPSFAGAGGPQFFLDVIGTGFTAGSRVRFGQTELATQFLSSGQLRATVPAALIAQPGVVLVSVVNPDGVSSNPAPFTVGIGFEVTELSPNTRVAGGPQFLMEVIGSGFVNGARVMWNGTPINNSFTSATRLQATIPANLVAAPGTAQVSVRNPDGWTSNALPFTITSALSISTLSRSEAVEGEPGFTLTINGAGFVAQSQVLWGSTALATTLRSATQMEAAVPAGLLASPGSVPVLVRNPGGAQSNSLLFTIRPQPLLVVNSISPDRATLNAPGFTMTVNGANFQQGAVVRWNTTELATTFVSATQLRAVVPANLLTAAGTAAISVVVAGRNSASLPFTITGPPPVTPSFTALPTIGVPAGQSNVGVSIASPAPSALTGTLRLTFTPNAIGVPSTYIDPDLRFAGGGSTVPFAIPQGAMEAQIFGGGMIQFGTVAGEVTITVASLNSGQTSVLSQPVSRTIRIDRQRPVILPGSVRLIRSGNNLTVELVGFATGREVATGRVQFSATGASIESGTTFDLVETLITPFRDWFTSTASREGGSYFRLQIPFVVTQGDASRISGVTVSLSNPQGTSESVSGN